MPMEASDPMLRSPLPRSTGPKPCPERVTAAVPEPSDEIDEEHPHSRRARLAARRRRIRWAGVLAVALIVGAAGTVAAFAFTDDAPAGPSAAVLTGATSAGNGSTSTTTTPAEALNVRPLSHADPLRLWVGGDSLSGALGPSLGTLAGDTGVVDTYVDYKVSSGLIPSTRNWQVYAPQLIAQEDPEAIVFMIGTNDANVVNSVDANKDGIHDWEVDYRERVANMMDLFVGGEKDRTVIWIGAPTMRDSQRDKGVLEVNRVMREEAEKRGPHVIYVDAYSHVQRRERRVRRPARRARRPGVSRRDQERSCAGGRRRAPDAGRRRLPRDAGVLAARQPLPAHRASGRRAPDQLHVGEGRRAVGFEQQRHPQRQRDRKRDEERHRDPAPAPRSRQ